ncbi:hypothetical protein ACWWD9_12520 [Methylovorus sp. SPW-M1]
MSDRYFSKVASVRDSYTIIISKGSEHGVKSGDKFLIVGLGEVIKDPDSGEDIEQLEIVRGKAIAKHVQNKVTTLESCEYYKSSDVREIKKVTTKTSGALSIFGPQDSVTESIKPGESMLQKFEGVKVGDFAIKL